MNRYPRLLVRVLDDDHIVNEALQVNDINLPGDVERDVCYFLGRLIEKFWKKFELRDIEVQCLLARKMSIEVSMSAEYLREFYEWNRSILENFHSFTLQVKDFYCYFHLEGSDHRGRLANLIYLERDMTESEEYTLDIPQRDNYMTYFLDLNLTEVFLTKLNPLRP